MQTHANETQENQSQSVAHEAKEGLSESGQAFQFRDNRPEAYLQRKIKDSANSDHRASQFKILRESKHSDHNSRLIAQLKSSNRNIIQKRKYKDREIKDEIKVIIGNVEPNSTAITLAVYNQMRHYLDPTPDVFKNIREGRTKMIELGVFDNEDADFLESEAARRQKAAGDSKELVKLQAKAKIDEKYDAVDAKYGHHIFQGDFKKGKPTGFHSKADNSSTHEAYGNETPIENGTYQQSVRSKTDPTNKKTNQSTFFPDNATHQNIIRAIASVFELGFKTVSYVDSSVDGIRLTKRGDTVYPAGGSDSLTAE